jgi:hypothetical protein
MLLIAALLACSPNTPEEDALEDARESWEENAPAHYRFVHDEWAFAPSDGPVEIEVQDGEVVSALIIETDQPAPASRELTIEDLFDVIEGELDDEPDAIEIRYDAELGYPESVDVDPLQNAMDDEHGFTVEHFEILD